MAILVTGAAGFIGSHLVKRLVDEGRQVIGVDNLSTGHYKNVVNLQGPTTFQFFHGDVCDDNFVRSFLNDSISEIYHLACPASPKAYMADMLGTLDTCYTGTRNMLELAARTKARFLLASTSEVYGDPLEHPQREEYFGNVNTSGPRSCYDEGKRVAETLCYVYRNEKQVDTRVARIFNTFGPQMDPQDGRVLTEFFNAVAENRPLPIFGNGKQTRTLNYVDYTVDGLLKIMGLDGLDKIINIGGEVELSVIQIAEIAHREAIAAMGLAQTPPLFMHLSARQDEPKQRKPSLFWAKYLLDYTPDPDPSVGISKMARDHFRPNCFKDEIGVART